jgi:hypothetical protein
MLLLEKVISLQQAEVAVVTPCWLRHNNPSSKFVNFSPRKIAIACKITIILPSVEPLPN